MSVACWFFRVSLSLSNTKDYESQWIVCERLFQCRMHALSHMQHIYLLILLAGTQEVHQNLLSAQKGKRMDVDYTCVLGHVGKFSEE